MSAIDPSRLTPPEVIQTISVEEEFVAMRDDLIAKDPSLAGVLALDSEPLTKLIQIAALRVANLRAESNDRAKALLLAYATGADLDHIGVTYYRTQRLVLDPGDPTAVPPRDPLYETDADYRARLLIAEDSYSTAGPAAAYIYHTKSASGDIHDVTVTSPTAGQVVVTVLTHSGNGVPDQALLDTVTAALNDDVRPLTDEVIVQAPTVIDYTVNATLTIYAGFNQGNIQASAQASLDTYVHAQHVLGRDITVTGVKASMLVAGVHDVVLNDTLNGTDLIANLIVADTDVAYCTGTTVAVGGTGG